MSSEVSNMIQICGPTPKTRTALKRDGRTASKLLAGPLARSTGLAIPEASGQVYRATAAPIITKHVVRLASRLRIRRQPPTGEHVGVIRPPRGTQPNAGSVPCSRISGLG